MFDEIMSVDLSASRTKDEVMRDLIAVGEKHNYHVVDVDMQKPWGGFVRFDTNIADDFVATFFPGLDPSEARLGHADLELSPKFLLVSPGARLSWQRHDRRAERWAYLTNGAYYKSSDADEPGEQRDAKQGDVVQFAQGECHRLVGVPGDTYTLVAEIWQHTDPSHPSEESDIERLADDYVR